jgi:uncharacterized membrane protein YjfL (UPF0719 family)
MLNTEGGEGHEDHAVDHHTHHIYKLLGLIMFMVMLILYITIGSYMEVKKFKFGHETGVIIIIGAFVSGLIYLSLTIGPRHDTWVEASAEVKESFEFPSEFFFEVLLPLIIFACGYNMRRKKFFENIVNIAKFGLLGTFLTFVFYTLFTWLLFE